ncbi:exodeoxyribonuclease VII large subunit [Pendulispora rubella]|uniref:Exodeoxyribonuclease 7 large subunit n=1 Tax=Pendulispora rubella TaxID=2741070 RepID=A0ABZ2L8H4_9BACT
MTIPFDFSRKAPPPPPPAAPPPPPPPSEERRIVSVAELGRVLQRTLEEVLAAPIWVQGEVSGVRMAPSGHVYFTLKDEREEAAIDTVMYRTNVTVRARRLLAEGARVRVRGKPTYWAPRGRLQFVVDRVEPDGKGALLEALEKLKEKLQAEGLFAVERKRPLPAEPRIIGVVTSATGAVIHDICKVAFRRGGANILLAPATVQGPTAESSIRYALHMLQQVRGVDVIIVGRGGGSSDDLRAFNDESVARAVAACRVPIVSAVGHEVDVTLTDFVADARAATPSQAAEMVVPDARARRDLLVHARARLERAMRARLTEDHVLLGRIERKLGDPRLAIATQKRTLDEGVRRMQRALVRVLEANKGALARIEPRLAAQHPGRVIVRERTELERSEQRLVHSARKALAARAAVVAGLAGRLDAMSPLKVLGRGYAIATLPNGHALRSADEVSIGERITVRLERGRLEAEVIARREEKQEKDEEKAL